MKKKDLEIELEQEKRNSKRLKSESNTWFFGMLFAIVSYMYWRVEFTQDPLAMVDIIVLPPWAIFCGGFLNLLRGNWPGRGEIAYKDINDI